MVTSKSVINISKTILDMHLFSSASFYIDKKIDNPFHSKGSIVLYTKLSNFSHKCVIYKIYIALCPKSFRAFPLM